jgi:hypothetical protein
MFFRTSDCDQIIRIRTNPGGNSALRVSITYYFTYERRAALAELLERLVDVVHGEYDA